MSRKAALMSLSACVVDEFQSVNEVAVVDERSTDQPLPPTAAASQPASRATQNSSSEPTSRKQRRRAWYYSHKKPNNGNREQPNNATNTPKVQRGAHHEQQARSGRLSGNTRSDLDGRTRNAQSCSSSGRLPVPPSSTVYAGQTQIFNIHHYCVISEQPALGSNAPFQCQRVVPNQFPTLWSMPYSSPLHIVAHSAHEQALGSQGRPQPQIQSQQQAFGAASTVAQHQGLKFIPQPSANSGHSKFPHVGVAITPSLRVDAEPRPMTRTQTMPV